jgi:4-carboxymuconolactone decarboxylase
MTTLSPRDTELVVLAAAVASNCLPCTERHIPEARKAGLSDEDIRAAIELADRTRQVPAKAVLDAARKTMDAAASCGCASDAAAPCAGSPGTKPTPSMFGGGCC